MAERPTRQQKRTTSEKAELVGMAVVQGIPQVASSTRTPERSLRRWVREAELAELAGKKPDEVRDRFWAGVQKGFDHLMDAMAASEDLGKIAVAFGIVYDKWALMSGNATARTEHRALTDDDDADALNAAADAYLAARGIAPRGVGDAAREGAAPDGHAPLHALPVPGGHPAGPLD